VGYRRSTGNLSPSAISTKIVIAGGFGAGKTTFVRSISEIEPVTTEAMMTEASEGFDDLAATPEKATTTVAMDFGRVSLDTDLALYLFGTPGQDRFWFLWDDLIRGALGAVVLADPRRLADCFPAVEYFENSPDAPFIVALNCFDGVLPYAIEDVRTALAIGPDVPVLACDARDTTSAVYTLTELVRYAMTFSGHPALV
jgi:signal recognition particle receptor subunit beta